MMTHEVSVHEVYDLPVALMNDAIFDVLSDVAAQAPPYAGLALTADLSALRLPLPGTVTEPIRLTLHDRLAKPPQRFRISIRATRGAAFFPKFDGWVEATPSGRAKSEVWLQGSYETPLGRLGMNLDETAFRGVAESSLKQLLSRIGADAATRVRTHEMEAARTHFHNR